MSEYEVRTCIKCPAKASDYERDRCNLAARDIDPGDSFTPPPDWCPLRLGPVTLRLVPSPPCDEQH